MEDPLPCHEGHDQARFLIDSKFDLTFMVTQEKVWTLKQKLLLLMTFFC